MDEVVSWQGEVHVGVHGVEVPRRVTVASCNRRLATSELEPTIFFVISVVAAHTWKPLKIAGIQRKLSKCFFQSNGSTLPQRKPFPGHV